MFIEEKLQHLGKEVSTIKDGLGELKKLIVEEYLEERRHNRLSVDEVCNKLDICKRTLTNWRTKGLIGYSQIGAKIYYTQQDVDDFIANHRIAPRAL